MPNLFDAHFYHHASKHNNRLFNQNLTRLTSNMFKPLRDEEIPVAVVFTSALDTLSETVELAVRLFLLPTIILCESTNDSGLFFESLFYSAANIILNAINSVIALLSLITRPLSSLFTETTPVADSFSTETDDTYVSHVLNS